MLPTVILSSTLATKKNSPGKDFFSRLEEDYQERGNATALQKCCKNHSKKGKILNHTQKRKNVNSLFESLLAETRKLPVSQNTIEEVKVPAALPSPMDLKMSPEDETLFRYFCVGKPAVWISAKDFNRDVPWCIYGQSQSNKALRHSILAKSALHVSRIRGESTVPAWMHVERALPLIQEALSNSPPDEPVICAVFYIMLTEGAFGEFQKVHNHMKGISLMYSHFMERHTEISPLMSYIAEVCGYLETLPGLLGWPLVIDDEILPKHKLWLKHLMVTPEFDRWIEIDFKHAKFQRQICRFKYWATSLRKRACHTAKDERKIFKEGQKVIQNLINWQEAHIPPYIEVSPESVDDVVDSRQFLDYPRLQFESALHAEIHLVFYNLLLITSFIVDPTPGAVSNQRVSTAIMHCRCLAAMGTNPGALAIETRSFGQFYVRLTFDDSYPEERKWAEERYSYPLHVSIIELHQVYYTIRKLLELEWGVQHWKTGGKWLRDY